MKKKIKQNLHWIILVGKSKLKEKMEKWNADKPGIKRIGADMVKKSAKIRVPFLGFLNSCQASLEKSAIITK
jgi:hypothetical protein